MYSLLAICTTLSPGPTDESIMSIVKEHYADQLQTLQRGGPESLEIYKDLFLSSCPKYLSVNPPPYEDASLLEQYISNPPTDATVRHLELFLSDVEAVRGVSGVRNLLKLYTSIDASKLAAFNSVEGQGEKEILEQLMVLKGASRTYSHQTGEGSSTLLDGDRLVTNNLDFTIDAVSPSSLPNIILNSSPCHLFNGTTAGLWPERLVLIKGNGARRRNNLSQTIRRILYP
jgi:translation initiation factor 3 subunit L